MKFILIHPPLWATHIAPCGIALVNAALRKRGIPVECHDLNIGLFKDMLSPKNVLRSFREVGRFVETCHGKDALTQAELYKLERCLRVMPAKRHLCEKASEITARFPRSGSYPTCARIESKKTAMSLIVEAVMAANYPVNPADYFENSAHAESFRWIEAALASPMMEPFVKLFERRTRQLIPDSGRHIVGFSCGGVQQVAAALLWSMMIKRINKRVHIVIGGSYFTLFRNNYANFGPVFNYVDYIVVGDGMAPAADIYDCLRGEKRPEDCRNLIWRNKQGESVFNGVTYIEDINRYPDPDFTGMPLSDYHSPVSVVPLAISRRCYGKCAYCGYDRNLPGKWQVERAASVVARMSRLKKKHNTPLFSFEVSTLPLRVLLDIAREIAARKAAFCWQVQTRIDVRLTPAECRRLYEGGCRLINFGMESANPRILALMKKEINITDATYTARNLARAGVKVRLNFIVDFPTETFEEFMDSVRFIKKNRRYLSQFVFSRFFLTRYSRIWNEPDRFKVKYRLLDESDPFLPRELTDAGIPREVSERKMNALSAFFDEMQGEFEPGILPLSMDRSLWEGDIAHIFCRSARAESALAKIDGGTDAWLDKKMIFRAEHDDYFHFARGFQVGDERIEIDTHLLYNRKNAAIARLNFNPIKKFENYNAFANSRDFIRATAENKEERAELLSIVKLLRKCGFIEAENG